MLYSAFLLAVVELDSSGALEWIVERIEGSIPIYFCSCGCVFLGLARVTDVLLALVRGDLICVSWVIDRCRASRRSWLGVKW